MSPLDLFESVPNFSEGKDQRVISAIASAAAPAFLLDVDADPDHHRTVVSLAGGRSRLVDGLVGAIGTAAERIDLRTHAGVHPRVGAADVVPIVPLAATSLDACLEVEDGLEAVVELFAALDAEARTFFASADDLRGPAAHPHDAGIGDAIELDVRLGLHEGGETGAGQCGKQNLVHRISMVGNNKCRCSVCCGDA